ncbi:MAG: hypothetical protein ACR2P2_10955 [Nakamurella sp.]
MFSGAEVERDPASAAGVTADRASVSVAATPAGLTVPSGSVQGHPRTHPVDAWTASADHLGGPYTDKTVRNIVHTSIGGVGVQVRLSNAFGTGPVTFDSVYLSRQSAGAGLVAGSNHPVKFGGSTTVTIPKGAEALSDPVAVALPAQATLAVSVHVSGDTGEVTGHSLAEQDSYYSDGNTASDESAASYVYPTANWFWLDAVLVQATAKTGTIAALDDSITDGY